MKKSLILGVVLLFCLPLAGQKVRTVTWTTNTDESQVPEYTLPDPLLCSDGVTKVTTVEMWENLRRPELVDMLTTCMYGKTPQLDHLGYELTAYEPRFSGGMATRKIVRVFLSKEGNRGPCVDVYVYTPNTAGRSKAPAFLTFNLMREDALLRLLRHGYGVVCFSNKEAAPDSREAWTQGIIPYYYRPSQTLPDPDQWGSIAAWAWTASRIMDYLEEDPDVDETKVVVHGHSRLGKKSRTG